MERIDDLQINGLKLIQDDGLFCFGCDAVELANFAGVARGRTVCDLGSGNGIIGVLLAGKYGKVVAAVEIQERCSELIRRNAELNGLADRIEVFNMPMQSFKRAIGDRIFDMVVCNPPYRKAGSGERQSVDAVSIARHEVAVTLSEVLDTAASLLSDGGKFFLIQEVARLSEVMAECVRVNLQPKVLQILTPTEFKPPHIFMLECLKGGKVGLKVKPQRKVGVER